MKVTGDEKGVRALKAMYSRDQDDTVGYLRAAKKRGAAYFRQRINDHYILYRINYAPGDVYKVTKFQEGSLDADGEAVM